MPYAYSLAFVVITFCAANNAIIFICTIAHSKDLQRNELLIPQNTSHITQTLNTIIFVDCGEFFDTFVYAEIYGWCTVHNRLDTYCLSHNIQKLFVHAKQMWYTNKTWK